jgi:hypothetical protein
MKRHFCGFDFVSITVSTNGIETMLTNVLGEMNQVVGVNDNHNEACANLGRLFFKYRIVFSSDIRCLSGSESGSSIMHMNEQKSLPPIAIVTIFQSYLKLTLRSCLILFTRDLALAMKRGMCE